MKIAHIYPAVSEVYLTAVKKKARDAMAMACGIPTSREYRRKRVIQKATHTFFPCRTPVNIGTRSFQTKEKPCPQSSYTFLEC